MPGPNPQEKDAIAAQALYASWRNLMKAARQDYPTRVVESRRRIRAGLKRLR